MDDAYSLEELLRLVEEKIEFGKQLVLLLQPIQDIDGVTKLQRKIRQEMVFLKKVYNY